VLITRFALKHGSVPSDSATKSNKIRILRYLIPTQLMLGYIPDNKLLGKYQDLKIYFRLVQAIKIGDLASFDKTFNESQEVLIKWGTWLIIEKTRLLAIRQLFRHSWKILNETNRLTVDLLSRSVAFASGEKAVYSNVCCLIVNLIDNNYMKGYISHEKQILVLSNKDPFPSLVKS
jgi:hypothetical protein